MEWEDYIENYFFTNNYGNYLIDLLFRRELIIGDCNPDKWCCLFNNILKWKKQYLLLGESLEVISFQAWYIHIDFCKFSLPLDKNYDIEEEIVRLNTFKLDEYLWYFIKTDTFVYVIQITDFG